MKECIIWIALYGVYWYISAIIGNILYDVTKINWINDIARIFLPFIFLGITYMVFKFKNGNTKVKIGESKALINNLKTIGIVLGAFFFAIILLMIYVVISLKK